jgi:saccharopine dehydrogenase (NAD+, L-lysine-forming)
MKIGLIRERKIPADKRVALTPVQCVSLMNRYPEVEVLVESSPDRCFSDEEYREAGIAVMDSLEEADVLMGIKEVPIEYLIPNKTYLFFSHTIKKQPYNRALFQNLVSRGIRMIDYEVIKWQNGQRVLGFGRFAGIVGAYNGLLTYGKKMQLFDLKPAHQCADYTEILSRAAAVELPPLKMVLTGGGRVAHGALDFLRNLRIREVTPRQFLQKTFQEPVFVHLNSPDLYQHPQQQPWSTEHFYQHHGEYRSRFAPYTKASDLLFNGLFWTEDLPRLFEAADTANPDFKLPVIADISCDVNGSVPLTYKATSIPEPSIGWDRLTQAPADPWLPNSIAVMAVTNLPNELPQDASEEFGENLLQYVVPELLAAKSEMIQGATLCQGGQLGEDFGYLADYL